MIDIRRIDETFDRFEELLTLIMTSFAYMDAIIDPPSSAHRLTFASLAEKAKAEIGFVAIENDRLSGCVFCKPEDGFLYIGKLAIDPAHQGRGLGRLLLGKAENVARALGLPALRLETRIELVENHATFARLGFVKTAEKSHSGFSRVTFIEMQKQLG